MTGADLAVRRLPIVPLYGPNEQLTSLLYRIANRYRLTVRDILVHIGYPPRRAGWPALLQLFGIRPEPDILARLSGLTGIDPTFLHSGTLAAWDGRAFAGRGSPLAQHQAAPRQIRRAAPGQAPWREDIVIWRGTQICPMCAREQAGRWPLRWRLTMFSICEHHQCLLVRQCPGCKEPHATKVMVSTTPFPGRCANSITGKLCQRRQDEEAVIVDNSDVIEAQSLVAAVAQGHAVPSGLTAYEFLRDVRWWARLLVRYGSADQLDRHLPGTSGVLKDHQRMLLSRPRLELPPNLQPRAVAGVSALAVELTLQGSSRRRVTDDMRGMCSTALERDRGALAKLTREDRSAVGPRLALVLREAVG